ncbi:ornithine cyclodeaminase family protein [Salinarimonas chemoclinalis]|uniref:ornithine cyclodeaminase family protein n=1 Tax=Salinarimonas chemoclinalis TaxID=3241599 RepID=UPI003555CB3D
MSQRPTIILTERDIGAIVSAVGLDALMDETIVGLREAFRTFGDGAVAIQKRTGFVYDTPEPGLVEFMPCYRRDRNVCMKVVGYHPGNPFRRGLPTIVATNSLYDVVDGHLLAIVDGCFATALRTGAASAVATEILAHPQARTLGIVGAGAQAVTQLHALSRIHRFAEVRVADRDPAVLADFPRRVARLGLRAIPSSLDAVLEAADVLVTATSVGVGEGPVFSDRPLARHLHVNAVGSDIPGKFELPRALLERAYITPDYAAQAVVEGECQQVRPGEIGAELHSLVKAPETFASLREATTVFDSTGCSLEDHVVTEILAAHAARLAIGERLVIESGSCDPMDPYAFPDAAVSAPAWTPALARPAAA